MLASEMFVLKDSPCKEHAASLINVTFLRAKADLIISKTGFEAKISEN